MKLLGIISLGFDVTDQPLIRFSASDTGEKLQYNETVHQLFIDFKKAHDSTRKEELYSILIKFGVPLNEVMPHNWCPLK
jgi:hypothetical protein